LTQLPSHPATELPKLTAIVDVDVAERAGWSPLDLAHAFLDGGARLLQLRAKHLSSALFLPLADEIVQLGRAFAADVIINDRVDVARLSGAAGVHVGQDDLPPADARALLGEQAIVGFSTHSREQIASAVREPVTYVAVGPVFGTQTKDTGYGPVGLELVRHAVEQSGMLPVVAIGGITLETAASVLGAGAASIAVISDLLTGGNPSARVKAYLRDLAEHRV
jgi:thiamine-phosphate pyrophosphorylase